MNQIIITHYEMARLKSAKSDTIIFNNQEIDGIPEGTVVELKTPGNGNSQSMKAAIKMIGIDPKLPKNMKIASFIQIGQ